MIKFQRKVTVHHGEDPIQSASPKTSEYRFGIERRLREGQKAFGVQDYDWHEHDGSDNRSRATAELERLRGNYYWGKTFEFRLVEWSD